MQTANIDLTIRRGATFSKILRWGRGVLAYTDIAGIVDKAPLTLDVPAHGVPDGWVVQIAGVQGLRGINSEHWRQASVIDPDTLALNTVNAAVMHGQYRGGGQVIYNKPVDLTGYTARMDIREYVHAPAPLASLSTAGGGIVVNPGGDYVQLRMDSSGTAGLDFRAGVYDLEMIAPGGEVYTLARGAVMATDEVTRP